MDYRIPGLSKAKAALAASLAQPKSRKKHGLFTVGGTKGVLDFHNTHTAEFLVIDADAGQSLIREIKEKYPDTPLFAASVAQMKSISNLVSSPPVCGVFRIPDSRVPEISDSRLYVALDGVQDPGNLGTIIRTCHWFGINTILASKDTVDVYNPKVVQATMGSLGFVNVYYCSLAETFECHPQMPVFGLLLDGADIFKAELPDSGFILMGNEGNGISAGLRNAISCPLYIPPFSPDHGESLNVAIATAIAVAQFRK